MPASSLSACLLQDAPQSPTVWNTARALRRALPHLSAGALLRVMLRVGLHAAGWMLLWFPALAVLLALAAGFLASSLPVATVAVPGVVALGARLLLEMVRRGRLWRYALLARVAGELQLPRPHATGGTQTPSAVGAPFAEAGNVFPPAPPACAPWAAGLLWAGMVLTLMAFPCANRSFHCKSKQSEAKGALKAISTTQLAYSGEYGTFLDLASLTSFGGMDERTLSQARYYRVTVETDGKTFRATARDDLKSIRDGKHDAWAITEADSTPVHLENGCQ